MSRSRIAILAVTYNGASDIPRFCRTIRPLLDRGDTLLVVVDNASTDNSVELVRIHCPEAYLIESKKNTGFAEGNNIAMRYAVEQGAEYVVLVNQDVSFDKEWLGAVLDEFAADPQCGAVQAEIRLLEDKDRLNSVGNGLHFLGFGYSLGHGTKAVEWDYSRSFFYLSGAAVVFKVSALKEVGLFDEQYFMYHEDTDLCWRLRLAGYSLRLCRDAVVYHNYEFARSARKFYYIERNRYITILKNYQLKTLIVLAPFFFFIEGLQLVNSVISLVSGAKLLTIGARMKIYGELLSVALWRKIREGRREVARIRKVSDRDLSSHLADEILFQDVTSPAVRFVFNPLSRMYWRMVRWML